MSSPDYDPQYKLRYGVVVNVAESLRVRLAATEAERGRAQASAGRAWETEQVVRRERDEAQQAADIANGWARDALARLADAEQRIRRRLDEQRNVPGVVGDALRAALKWALGVVSSPVTGEEQTCRD